MDKVVKGVKMPTTQEGAAEKAGPRFVGSADRKMSETVTLAYPVEYDGVTYSELTVSRLRGKDFRRMSELTPKLGADIALLACMTGAPGEVLDEMDFEDFTGVMKAAQAFLPSTMLPQAAASNGGESSS